MNDEKSPDSTPPAARPRLGRALARLMDEAPPVTGPAPAAEAAPAGPQDARQDGQPGEHGGPKGPEPTRYGDWERKGRCIDF
jgi:hypothetical protein